MDSNSASATYRRIVLLAVVMLVISLAGCGKLLDTSPLVLTSTSTGTVYEIPVGQVKDREITPDPGKNDEDVIAVVTVPPSEKTTAIKIYKRPKPLTLKAKEIITGDKGSPDYSLTSDNKDVQAKTERDIGLWPWIVGGVTILAGILAARKWLASFGWLVKIMSFLRKIVGL